MSTTPSCQPRRNSLPPPSTLTRDQLEANVLAQVPDTWSDMSQSPPGSRRLSPRQAPPPSEASTARTEKLTERQVDLAQLMDASSSDDSGDECGAGRAPVPSALRAAVTNTGGRVVSGGADTYDLSCSSAGSFFIRSSYDNTTSTGGTLPFPTDGGVHNKAHDHSTASMPEARESGGLPLARSRSDSALSASQKALAAAETEAVIPRLSLGAGTDSSRADSCLTPYANADARADDAFPEGTNFTFKADASGDEGGDGFLLVSRGASSSDLGVTSLHTSACTTPDSSKANSTYSELQWTEEHARYYDSQDEANRLTPPPGLAERAITTATVVTGVVCDVAGSAAESVTEATAAALGAAAEAALAAADAAVPVLETALRIGQFTVLFSGVVAYEIGRAVAGATMTLTFEAAGAIAEHGPTAAQLIAESINAAYQELPDGEAVMAAATTAVGATKVVTAAAVSAALKGAEITGKCIIITIDGITYAIKGETMTQLILREQTEAQRR